MKDTLERLGIHKSWHDVMIPLFKSKEMLEIQKVIGACISKNIQVYPKKGLVFRPFLMPFNEVKVVILGQCPYPDGKGTGLAFAINKTENKIPYSLGVIHGEIERTYNPLQKYSEADLYFVGQDLLHWEKQGVLLLNSALTVQHNKPGSHLNYWRFFIERIIKHISDESTSIIFCLWGKQAQSFESIIDKQFHYILKASHPAKGSYTGQDSFLGCNHFKKIDKILLNNNNIQINWYEKKKNRIY